MKKDVVLSIRGRQTYADMEPEVIELVTEGVLEDQGNAWLLSYEESDLTGMGGVTTTFIVEPDKVTLKRTGKLNSQMIFQKNVVHESLYQMPFGALMLSVKATRVFFDIVPDGGVIDLSYDISIENSEAGVIDYHLDIRAK